MRCPKCGGRCDRDSVDVGIGIMFGPYGCEECGWSEDPKYDMTNLANRRPDARGGYRDQWGGYNPPGSMMALAFKLAAEAETATLSTQPVAPSSSPDGEGE